MPHTCSPSGALPKSSLSSYFDLKKSGRGDLVDQPIERLDMRNANSVPLLAVEGERLRVRVRLCGCSLCRESGCGGNGFGGLVAGGEQGQGGFGQVAFVGDLPFVVGGDQDRVGQAQQGAG